MTCIQTVGTRNQTSQPYTAEVISMLNGLLFRPFSRSPFSIGGGRSRGTREELLSSRSQKLCLFFLSLSLAPLAIFGPRGVRYYTCAPYHAPQHSSVSLSGGLGTKTPFADISDSIPLPIRPVWPLGVSKWIIWRPTSVPEKRERERERRPADTRE